MLKLYDGDYGNLTFLDYIGEADSVLISEAINEDYTLSFYYPQNAKCKNIKVNNLVECEGQFYRIISVIDASMEMIRVSAMHIYDADSPTVHIPMLSDHIGVNPQAVLQTAFQGSGITLISDRDDLVGNDGFLIDFFAVDKTSPKGIMQSVIENCGFGEVYKDNKSVALIERLGTDKKTRLDLRKNVSALTITRDMGNIVNRLYAYGKDDATMDQYIGAPYIDSVESIEKYGLKVGYKDYSDYTKPQDIYKHAIWEFDERNKDRIDIPSITIEGSVIDLAKIIEGENSFNLGDSVIITDIDGNSYEERIIKREYYPYEPRETSITIGRVKKDMAFYMAQMGKLAGKYSKVSTNSGKITAHNVTGAVSATTDNVNISASGTQTSDKLIRVIVNNNTKVNIGISGSNYVFTVYDKNGVQAMGFDTSGNMTFNGSQITIGGKILKVTGGNLTIDGKKILTEE